MKKGFLITGTVLVIAGLALAVGAIASVGFDFTRIGTAKFETNTYAPDGAFDRIEIDTDESDVEIRPAEDGKCSVVCVELENARHLVSVENGELKIRMDDRRDWTDRIVLFSNRFSVTVYIPLARYESLKVMTDTGDISVPDAFSEEYAFGGIAIASDTGDVTCGASAEGSFGIETKTGDIRISGIRAGEISLSVSTGKVEAGGIVCSGTVTVKVGTGKTAVSGMTCGNFVSDGSTGDVTLKDTVASESMKIKRSTGDIRFENCDAGEMDVNTSTGDVTGSIRTVKIFRVKTSTGSVRVPDSVSGGKCAVTTNTGDIRIVIADGAD